MKRVTADSPRTWLYQVIFKHNTREGRLFDVALIWAVMLSVVVVILESVTSIRARFHDLLLIAEWVFTIVFTIEYGLRLYSARRRWRYALSFFGIIDLIAILPTYLSLLIPGTQTLVVVRIFRTLRVFRVLKLSEYRAEAKALRKALGASTPKIVVFLGSVLSVVVIAGAIMYLIEGPEHGFADIPRSMYWAVVTMTTVGYGDIAPQTTLGRGIASFIMILGYGIIAVPTGIVSAELTRKPKKNKPRTPSCERCALAGHAPDAQYCRVCGERLPSGGQETTDAREAT